MRQLLGPACCLIILLLGAASVCSGFEEASWKEIKGKHFIIKYVEDPTFARAVLNGAEVLYDAILNKLGFKKYGNFWLWDDRASIWIYPDRDSFVESENAPGWAAGKANTSKREIRAYKTDADFLKTVLPHELSHLIFREFAGVDGNVPAWLEEGVAQLQEKGRDRRLAALAVARAQRRLFTIKSLMAVKPKELSGSEPAVFYAQSLSIVEFMIEEFGSSRFRKFCGQLKSGKGMDDALRFTYPSSVRSIQDLEKAWLKHLEDSK